MISLTQIVRRKLLMRLVQLVSGYLNNMGKLDSISISVSSGAIPLLYSGSLHTAADSAAKRAAKKGVETKPETGSQWQFFLNEF